MFQWDVLEAGLPKGNKIMPPSSLSHSSGVHYTWFGHERATFILNNINIQFVHHRKHITSSLQRPIG
jgi:hypothetical protein